MNDDLIWQIIYGSVFSKLCNSHIDRGNSKLTVDCIDYYMAQARGIADLETERRQRLNAEKSK